jgi:hypothetical protein
MKFLFIGVPEVKIEIGHRGPPSVAQGNNFLYDRGAELMKSVSQGRDELEKGEPDDTFP